MIKLSASAVRGFVEECYRKGLNEQQAAYLLERSLDTSDVLLYKEAADDEWKETTKEKFFKAHPEAKKVYETPKYRKDPKYAAFFAALDGKGKGKKLLVNKKNHYKFKVDIPGWINE